MTLNQLRYFCTASRCHSITKAAEELYVTQPTVSTAIRDLEIEFGISLFYRKGNQLILTGEGETLYEKANYILQYCTELQSFTVAFLPYEKHPVNVPLFFILFFLIYYLHQSKLYHLHWCYVHRAWHLLFLQSLLLLKNL